MAIYIIMQDFKMFLRKTIFMVKHVVACRLKIYWMTLFLVIKHLRWGFFFVLFVIIKQIRSFKADLATRCDG